MPSIQLHWPQPTLELLLLPGHDAPIANEYVAPHSAYTKLYKPGDGGLLNCAVVTRWPPGEAALTTTASTRGEQGHTCQGVRVEDRHSGTARGTGYIMITASNPPEHPQSNK